MTFTLDSRKFEYVDVPRSGTATPAKKEKKGEATSDVKEGRSDEPEAGVARGGEH